MAAVRFLHGQASYILVPRFGYMHCSLHSFDTAQRLQVRRAMAATFKGDTVPGIFDSRISRGVYVCPIRFEGLVQRGMALVILVWLLLTGWHLRRAMPSTSGTAAS